jgi:hypothetical protein
MTREQFAQFLAELKKASDNGQDIDAIVKKHEHENVYFYNDGCIKKILANEKNLALTTDLINAALNLIGTDRIKNPKLVNPFIPGEIGYKSVEPDLLLVNERGKNVPRDRISVDVQHETGSFFKDRLVLYVSRLTNNMVKRGDVPKLDNLHVISFQFFNAFAESTNYRHKVQLQNQEQQVYFDRQTVTLIEVEKFLKNAQNFADDNSRLAQWLRAIDSLNRGADFSEYAQDPVFRLLQNEVKMSNFSSRYLMTEAMMVLDKDYIFYDAQDKKAREIARDMLLDNEPIDKIVKYTKLPDSEVLEIKASLDRK